MIHVAYLEQFRMFYLTRFESSSFDFRSDTSFVVRCARHVTSRIAAGTLARMSVQEEMYVIGCKQVKRQLIPLARGFVVISPHDFP